MEKNVYPHAGLDSTFHWLHWKQCPVMIVLFRAPFVHCRATNDEHVMKKPRALCERCAGYLSRMSLRRRSSPHLAGLALAPPVV